MNLTIPTFKSMQRKMGIATTLFVLVGVMVSFFYLSVIDPLPTSGDALHQMDWFGFGVTILIVVILYFAGAARGKRLDSRISAWYEPLRLGEQRSSIPKRVKRDVLNYPIINATNSALMWTMAGVLFALLTGSFRVFVGLTLVAGLLTSVMLYFASDLIWRPAIPLFFPPWRLEQHPRFSPAGVGQISDRLSVDWCCAACHPGQFELAAGTDPTDDPRSTDAP